MTRLWLALLGVVVVLGCDDAGAAANHDGGSAATDGAPADGRPAADAAPRADAGPAADGAPSADALPAPDGGPSADGGPGRPPGRALCDGGYAAPREAGALADPELVEVSGMAVSLRNPGVLWMHNDSGDEARLFAVGTDGGSLGRLRLAGVEAVDFEDLAAAPCPDGRGPCLWVGDIGDNAARRDSVVIYVIPEPAVDPAHPFGERVSDPVRRYEVRYPDGPVDAEALVAAPDGSTFYIFEKVDGDRARFWRHPGPLVHGRSVTLAPVGSFAPPGFSVPRGRMITAADLHPTGRRLALRVYTGTYEYRFEEGRGLEALADVEPVTVAVGPLSEPQGEAVAYDAEGRGLWTVSEDPAQAPGQPLHHYACRDEGGP